MPVRSASTQVRLHLDAAYSSSYNSFHLEPTRTDAGFLVNGRLAPADIGVSDRKKITLAVWPRNMFNRHYIYCCSAANSSPVFNSCGANGLNRAAGCTPNALISTSYGGILGDYGNFNAPRTFGLELSAKF